MANDSLKALKIAFQTFVESYDANCVLSKAVSSETIDGKDAQRAGDVMYVRQNYEASTVTGLDVSGETDMDVIQRAVPIAFRDPENVIFNLNSKEARDEQVMTKQGEAAAKSLAAFVDQSLYATGVGKAANVITQTGAFDWTLGATVEEQMILRGISTSDAKLFMNAGDWRAVADELGGRQYTTDRTKGAYERSQVPDIANLQTFRTDNLVNVAGVGTVTGTTINGAQSHTVVSKDGNNVPVDNRQMTLTVQGANIGNIALGDSFTIAGVNAVHMKTKSDTNVPQTFRVIAAPTGGGTTLTVTPAIVASGPYQNVTAVAADSAAVTFINSTTKAANLAFAGDALQLKYGRLEFPNDMGPKVMTATTENGVPLCMSYNFDDRAGKISVRYHTYFADSLTDPEKAFLVLANQS